MSPRTRKTSVRGANYVTHIKAGQLTLCGRWAARVNCQGPGEEVNEATCRACARVHASVDKTAAL